MMFIAAKSPTGCTFEKVIPLDVPDGTPPPPVASLTIETIYQTSGKLPNTRHSQNHLNQSKSVSKVV